MATRLHQGNQKMKRAALIAATSVLCRMAAAQPSRTVSLFLLCFCVILHVEGGRTASDDAWASGSVGNWLSTQLERLLCQRAQDGIVPSALSDEVVISANDVPLLEAGTSFSQPVSVSTLARDLIGDNGDSVFLVLLAVGNDAVIEWQSVAPSGAALPLPSIAVPTLPGTPTEVQFDNRFGFYHFSVRFSPPFVQNVTILTPQDRFRFKLLADRLPDLEDRCPAQSLLFTFVQMDPNLQSVLLSSKSERKQLFSLSSCSVWPFGDLVFRMCPGFANASVPGGTFFASTTGAPWPISVSTPTAETFSGGNQTRSETSTSPSQLSSSTSTPTQFSTLPSTRSSSQSLHSESFPQSEGVLSSSAVANPFTKFIAKSAEITTSTSPLPNSPNTSNKSTLSSAAISTDSFATQTNSVASSEFTDAETSASGTDALSTSESKTPSSYDFSSSAENESGSSTRTASNLQTLSDAPETSSANTDWIGTTVMRGAVPDTGSTPADAVVDCAQDVGPLCAACVRVDSDDTCYASVYPRLFDFDDAAKVINVTLNLTVEGVDLGNPSCSLTHKSLKTPFVTIVEAWQDASFRVQLQEATPSDDGALELLLSCSIANTALFSDYLILVDAFQDLVQHKTPFVSKLDALAPKKSVYVTFRNALPAQFTVNDNDHASGTCVFGDAAGRRFKGKLETPSVMNCDLSDLSDVGVFNMFAIRRKELEGATFEYQKPLAVSVAPLLAATTTAPVEANSAIFFANLTGVQISFGPAANVTDRMFDCAQLFLSTNSLGNAPVCQTRQNQVLVALGPGATVIPHEPLLVRSGMLTDEFLDATGPKTQYDVVSLDVPVDAVSPQATLQEPAEAIACQSVINISLTEVSGDGGRPLTLAWNATNAKPDLAEFLNACTNASISLAATFLADGPLNLSVTACNFVHKCVQAGPVRVSVGAGTTRFAVAIGGLPVRPLPSMKIALVALPTLISCNSTFDLSRSNISYMWSLNGTRASHDSVFTIPAKTYRANSNLAVSLMARYWSPTVADFFESSVQDTLHYGAEDLVLVVDGADRAVSAGAGLVLDASRSFDPNTGSHEITHAWKCALASGAECGLKFSSNTSVVEIGPGKLKAGQSYVFTDSISNALGASTAASVTVEVLAAAVPTIRLVPQSSTVVPAGDYVRVQAFVLSSTGQVSTEWQLRPTTHPDETPIALASVFPLAKRDFEEEVDDASVVVSFTLPTGLNTRYPAWTGLSAGEYAFRLVAQNDAGSAFTELAFRVVAPPSTPTVSVNPVEGISALETPVQLDASDLGDPTVANSLVLRFGVRTLLVGNESQVQWFRRSALKRRRTILAAAWPEPNAACSRRIGYEGLLEVCDYAGACTTAHTDRFVVQHAMNGSLALENILAAALADIANGDTDTALTKLQAVQQERCDPALDSVVVDALIDRVLADLQASEDVEELLSGVAVCCGLLGSASPDKVAQVMALLTRTQQLAVGSFNSAEAAQPRRTRRSTQSNIASLTASGVNAVSEAVAGTLLDAYDNIARENRSISTSFWVNVKDVLVGFCTQTGLVRVLTAQGTNYTQVYAEGLSPMDATFLNETVDVFSPEILLTFDSDFQSTFKSFKCGPNKQTACSDMCLATAVVSRRILSDNYYMLQYFFENSFSSVNSMKLQSDIFYVVFNDPLGISITLPPGIGFNISIPVSNYVKSNYYACFVFVNGGWDSSPCKSESFALKVGNNYLLQCRCELTGIISVFQVQPPPPPFFPRYNEVIITFALSTTVACTKSERSNFLDVINASAAVALSRLVNSTCTNGTSLPDDPATIVLKLRPPFRPDQQSNSEAMQAIERAVNVGGNLVAYGKVYVTGMNSSIAYRKLQGDGYARKVPLIINRSLKDAVGNNSDAIGRKWIAQIATTSSINPDRFKNVVLANGIVFNFTITLPYEDEVKKPDVALSAEEISLYIAEQTQYRELELLDVQEQLLYPDPLVEDQIVQLRVQSSSNTLMTAILATVLAAVALSTVMVVSFVFLKLRTDRLIEEHNRNIRTVQIQPADQMVSVLPVEPHSLPVALDGLNDAMDNAADTVVLGRNRHLRHR